MIRHRTVILLLLASSAAGAQPARPADNVPTKSVPCAMWGDLELRSVGEDPVLCWDAGCMQLNLSKSTAALVPKPEPASAWVEPTAEVKDNSVCLGATCKKLGNKLVAALANARDTLPQYVPKILATTDLETVVIGPTAWNVARDRRIKLAIPRGLATPLGKNNWKPVEVSYIDVAGDLLLVHWSNCVDGFCTRAFLTDQAGRAIGAHRDGGGLAPIQLDPETGFVFVSEQGSLQFYDMKSRKFEAPLKLAARPWTAVRIDKDTIAVLYETFADSNSLHVAKIVWGVEPFVQSSIALPRCGPYPIH